MNIRREEDVLIMSTFLVCPNFSNANIPHYKNEFEEVTDNKHVKKYKCKECGATMSLTRVPIIIHDDRGMIRMQIAVDIKDDKRH